MSTTIYKEDFKIRSSEVNSAGKIRLPAICDLLQEVAGSNALELNFDISHLNDQNLTWVLHRLHVQMDRYPEWRETITIQTWPSGGDTLRAYRDFRIMDSAGKEISRSLSYWLMLDMEKRRPVRIPDNIIAMASENEDHVLPVQKQRIELEEPPSGFKTFQVRRSDLDINKHVNNVKYVEWALEPLPEDKTLTEIDIEFRAECTYGDEITSGVLLKDDATGLHQLSRTSDKKTAAVALTRF